MNWLIFSLFDKPVVQLAYIYSYMILGFFLWWMYTFIRYLIFIYKFKADINVLFQLIEDNRSYYFIVNDPRYKLKQFRKCIESIIPYRLWDDDYDNPNIIYYLGDLYSLINPNLLEYKFMSYTFFARSTRHDVCVDFMCQIYNRLARATLFKSKEKDTELDEFDKKEVQKLI